MIFAIIVFWLAFVAFVAAMSFFAQTKKHKEALLRLRDLQETHSELQADFERLLAQHHGLIENYNAVWERLDTACDQIANQKTLLTHVWERLGSERLQTTYWVAKVSEMQSKRDEHGRFRPK